MDNQTTHEWEDPEIGLAHRLIDTLPTFTVTGTGKDRCVTATVRYECDDIRSFAKTRAEQLTQLIDMAENCEPEFKSVLRAVVYDMTREVAGLVKALSTDEVRHGRQ